MYRRIQYTSSIQLKNYKNPDEIEETIRSIYTQKILNNNSIMTGRTHLINKESLNYECCHNHASNYVVECVIGIDAVQITRGSLYLCMVRSKENMLDGKSSKLRLIPICHHEDGSAYTPYLLNGVDEAYAQERVEMFKMTGIDKTNFNSRIKIGMTMYGLNSRLIDSELMNSLSQGSYLVCSVDTCSSKPNSTKIIARMLPTPVIQPIKFVAIKNMPKLNPDMKKVNSKIGKLFAHSDMKKIDSLIVGETYCLGIQGYFEPTDDIGINTPLDGEELITYINNTYTNWQEIVSLASTYDLDPEYLKYLK